MEKNIYTFQPEIWGGVECTINRVNNSFLDQLQFSGHYEREDDIDVIASLGVKALRFPILWERHQRILHSEICWDWVEQQLKKLQQYNITPIAGLLHHGSGPAFTNLADKHFPELFSDYAFKVASQFPFLSEYTPINEPLTTARFSGLYGHWYPHEKNALQFIRMLLNQIKGVVLAMKKIRSINKEAKLIQTEDLGKTYSTDKLKYQADFENQRRWLTFDLLNGAVSKQHPLWSYLLWLGIKKDELEFFSENICVPDVIGVNHYITSERYLDHECSKYPSHHIGSNSKDQYVDVDAIRVEHGEPFGLEVLLNETWERYHTPIAVTEIQLNCHREHQLRWFKQAFDTCTEINRDEIKVTAVTAWALLGAHGWNKLVTMGKGEYESGVFDIRHNEPRKTALYHLVKSFAENTSNKFQVLNEPGWWQMKNRFIHKRIDEAPVYNFSAGNRSQPILISGKRGTLGFAFGQICEQRGLNYRLLSRDEMDISNYEEVLAAINKYKPWAIINAAGFVRVDDAEAEKEKCFTANVEGPKQLAAICRQHGIKLLTFSSDLVFNGEKKDPYLESDKVYPLNVYGDSKAKGEKAVLENNSDALIIRTSAFFGPWDRYNFVYNVLHSLNTQTEFQVAHDVFISPTYVPDLVNSSLNLLIDDAKNIWHVSNLGCLTWADLAKEVAQRGGCDVNKIKSQPLSSMFFKAARPSYSVLKSERGIQLPALENALERYFSEKCIA